jgi:hypothetical protein
MEFSLSLRGLANANALPINPAFVFRIGNHTYSCGIFAAAFISPRVVQMQRSDCLASLMTLDIDDSTNQFQSALNLANGLSVRMHRENASYYLALGEQLGNPELIEAARTFRESEGLTRDSVIPRIMDGLKYGLTIDTELSFYAAHFSEFSIEAIRRLPVSIIELILQNPGLELKSDSHLLRVIIRAGTEYHSLLRYVNFEFLDSDALALLADSIPLESLDPTIWRSICRVFVQGAGPRPLAAARPDGGDPLSAAPRKSGRREFQLDPKRPFHGILDFLNGIHSRNCHFSGLVNVTASSTGECAPVHRIVEYQRTDWFFTSDLANSWIKIDFKWRKVWVKSYQLRGGRAHCTNLRTWVLEGSDDDQDWTVLNEVRHSKLLSGDSAVHDFLCAPQQPFQYIRLKQTDLNDKGRNSLVIATIELYGHLLE